MSKNIPMWLHDYLPQTVHLSRENETKIVKITHSAVLYLHLLKCQINNIGSSGCLDSGNGFHGIDAIIIGIDHQR